MLTLLIYLRLFLKIINGMNGANIHEIQILFYFQNQYRQQETALPYTPHQHDLYVLY